MTGPLGIRAEVVDLLTDHDPVRSSFLRKPWRLYHLGGVAFTAAESGLANTATVAELAAAQRHAARKRDDLTRVMELLVTIPGWEDMEILEAVAQLPIPDQAEVVGILSRYSPADLQG